MYPTLSGEVARIHISNAYGKAPLVIEELRIARSGAGAGVQVGTEARVTFGGKQAVSVPPGGEIDSDPVRVAISAGVPYAVSSYMGREQKLIAWHRVSSQGNYLSMPGNHAGDASADAYRQRITQFAWVTGVQVEAPVILHKGGLTGCIKNVMASLRFPKSGMGQVVSFPFSLM